LPYQFDKLADADVVLVKRKPGRQRKLEAGVIATNGRAKRTERRLAR